MCAEEGLGDDLGLFGRKHADDKDCTFSMSVMVVLSDLPPDHEPGRFHIPGLGIYVQLETFSTIFFSGRLQHGGTPPLGPAGQPAEDWACRCVVIGYPSGAYVNGTIRHALGALPHKKEPLYLAPEMIGIEYVLFYATINLHVLTLVSSQSYDNVDRIDRSNMAMDGMTIMDRQSHLDWFARSLLLLNRSLIRQLPSSYQVEVDSETFLDAFSLTVNGERCAATPWKMAPDPAVHEPEDAAQDGESSVCYHIFDVKLSEDFKILHRYVKSHATGWPIGGTLTAHERSQPHQQNGQKTLKKGVGY